MAWPEDLTTARDNLSATWLTLTATLSADLANPKTSYSVDGHSFSHTEHLARLTAQIDEIAKQVRELTEQIILAQGAVEIPTTALS